MYLNNRTRAELNSHQEKDLSNAKILSGVGGNVTSVGQGRSGVSPWASGQSHRNTEGDSALARVGCAFVCRIQKIRGGKSLAVRHRYPGSKVAPRRKDP